MVSKYTKEDVIATLQKFKQIGNGNYTKNNYYKLGLKPTYPTICTLFEGGWKEALSHVGLSPMPQVKYSNNEILEQLKACYIENNNRISHAIYINSKRKPSLTVIEERFQTFTNALIEAGIESTYVENKRFTDEEILEVLRRFYREKGNYISYPLYEKSKEKPSASVIRKRFKTWNNALEQAGIPINKSVDSSYTEEEMIRALQDVADKAPYILSRKNYKKYASEERPSVITIVRHFKTWNNALEQAGLPTIPKYDKAEMLKSIEEFIECYGEDSSHDLYIKVGWLPGMTSIQRHFGTWENALKEINHNLKYAHYTKEYAIAQLRLFAENYSEPLTSALYKQSQYKPSLSWIKKNFGSWQEAKNEAGIN